VPQVWGRGGQAHIQDGKEQGEMMS
jgi:hypothetical protein